MRHYLAAAGALALSLCVPGAQAHHSMAMFDQAKKVTVTGTVKQFEWTNPHCYIQLTVKGANGATEEWSMEMGAPMYLYAEGWRPSTVKPGSQVNITINPLRNGGKGGVVLYVTSMDGKPLGKKA
jgi:hypothetical protein